jgi:hypothetical protein
MQRLHWDMRAIHDVSAASLRQEEIPEMVGIFSQLRPAKSWNEHGWAEGAGEHA